MPYLTYSPPRRFARTQTEILPKYFRHSRFQSLVRQLNFYSFKKISKERSVCIYQHHLFLRDRPDQLEHLKRKTSNGDKFRSRAARGAVKEGASAKPYHAKGTSRSALARSVAYGASPSPDASD